MRYWFIGDTHFGHTNIIKYCNRSFKTLEEMDSTLIKNWNERVDKEDTIFMLGDFCFKNTPNSIERGEGNIYPASYYEKQLNGKVIFVRGSHDKNNGCKTCIGSIRIKLGGKDIYLVHDPNFISIHCDFNLVAHVHQLWKFKRFKKGNTFIDCINVGVDQWNFKPITIEEILREYNNWVKNGKF